MIGKSSPSILISLPDHLPCDARRLNFMAFPSRFSGIPGRRRVSTVQQKMVVFYDKSTSRAV
jgi:hypothetical protein